MTPKPPRILNREPEWRELTAAWESDRPELVFVLGRRRVGKSFVLAPFARAVGGIYYQATRRSEAEQLDALTQILGGHFGDPALTHGAPFRDWENLFRYLIQKVGERRFLLVLDEFPYLEASAPALPSVIQALVDHELAGTRVKLILSGSQITAMRRLEGPDQPLYARRSRRILIKPFPYFHAAEFVSGYAPLDRIRAYGIFGGLPGHLALLEAGKDLATNVARHVLSPTARLFDEAQHMLDAFLGDAEVHYSIIEAIARGAGTWSGIASRVGKGSGSLSRPLNWLVEMDVVARVVPVTERSPAKSKRALYRITDPYVRFWHRFLSPLIQMGIPGQAEPERIWEERVEPGLDDYMGEAFEEVCRTFVAHTDALPFRPLRVGSWWDARSENEIDLVALSEDESQVVVGECKWGAADARDLQRLRERADLLVRDMGRAARLQLALFSGRAATEEVRSEVESGKVLYFSAADLTSLT